MIELRGIETFYWIATLGSFRAAAEKMHTSQPAVSQRISQLEHGLAYVCSTGTSAVYVSPRRDSHYSHMLNACWKCRNDMLTVARTQGGVSGRLCIGVAETIVQTWLPTLLERVHNIYPDLVLEIEVDTTSILRTHLLSRQIDLAFLMGPVDEANVENLPLCQYPLAWLASPRPGIGQQARYAGSNRELANQHLPRDNKNPIRPFEKYSLKAVYANHACMDPPH